MAVLKSNEQYKQEAIVKFNGLYSYERTVYTGAFNKIIVICPIHQEFSVQASNHLNGQGCQICALEIAVSKGYSIRLTNEDINHYLIKNNVPIQLVSNYERGTIPVKWKCLICPNEWTAAVSTIKSRPYCSVCNGTKISDWSIDKFVSENNLRVCRIGHYVGAKSKIDWQCLDCNKIWAIQYHEMKKRAGKKYNGCPDCNPSHKPFSDAEIDKFILDNELHLKRIGHYVGQKKLLKVQCIDCSHSWEDTFHKIKQKFRLTGDNSCPKCSSINQYKIGAALDELEIIHERLIIRIPNEKRIFPDYYLPKFNMIIEYNGLQHYQPVRFGGMTRKEAELAFQRQIMRDNLLRQYCKNHNINLLEIDWRDYQGRELKEFVLDYFRNKDEKDVGR